MIFGARRFVVSKNKQFILEYRVPSDQVPSGQSVYADIVDSSGNYVGSPVQLSRVGTTDVVRATITAPSTVGKYEIKVWIGTWDGSTRTVTEVVDYLGLEVVDKDLEDRVADLETALSSVQSTLSDIETKLDTIMKWLKRLPL